MSSEILHIRPHDGVYVHGIDLDDFFPCWNLALSGQLVSSEFGALCDSNIAQHQNSIRHASLTTLKTPQYGFGAVTPRAACYIASAAIIRGGGHLGIGVKNTKWMSRDDMDRILRISDLEIAFEELRRGIAPTAASRLCCLWVAEDSPEGHAHVRSMLGLNIFILQVAIIAAVRVTRTDTRWFDAYVGEAREEFIVNYWNSVPFDAHTPTWEHLIEGVIAVTDEHALAHVREHGAHIKLMAQPASHP